VVAAAPDLDTALEQVASARQRLGLPPSRVEMLLPSRVEQARRIERWNQFWSVHGESLVADFTRSCYELGLRPAAFSASFARYQPSGKELGITMDDWRGTPIERGFATAVTKRPDGWQVASAIADMNFAHMIALTEKAEGLGLAPAWVASQAFLGQRMVSVFTADLIRRSLMILLAIVVAVAVIVRSLRAGAAMLLPPIIAMVWTFGLVGWLGIDLTPFAVLTAVFVGGIGIDCAIFLSSPEHRATLITPSVACMVTAAAGTACMLVARHPLLNGIGLMITLGMLACLLACLLLLAAIMGRQGQAVPPGNEP